MIWKSENITKSVKVKPKTTKVVDIAKHQTGKSNKKVDASRSAFPPGKRISKSGKIYFEYRANRTDVPGTNL